MPTVAVVITCHNYGHYLKECVDSVLAQTTKVTEIIVVDDLSTDDTSTVCSEDVSYLYVTNRNLYLSRRDGFKHSTSEYLIFLDADDLIGPDYVEKCLEHFVKHPTCGVVTSNVMKFGDSKGEMTAILTNIAQFNWAHCASMVRRTALVTSGAFESKSPPTLHMSEDWYVWRKVSYAGWNIGRIADYNFFYRKHGQTMSHGVKHQPYYVQACLHDEPLTLVIPLARSRNIPRLREWLIKNSGYFTDILIIDSTDKGHELLNCVDEVNTTHIKLPVSDLVDKVREGETYTKVQESMCKVYRHLDRVHTEYMLIVEDDVLPPDDCPDMLLRSMAVDVGAVTAMVPSRTSPGRILAGNRGGMFVVDSRTVVQQVDFSGFGCLLLRKSVFDRLPPPHVHGNENYDINFFNDMKNLKFKLLLDWSIKCQHGGL